MTKGCNPCGELDSKLKKVKGEIAAFEAINAASRQPLQDDLRRGFGYWINRAYGFNIRRIEPDPNCGDCHHLRSSIDGLIRRAIKKHPRHQRPEVHCSHRLSRGSRRCLRRAAVAGP